MRKPHIISSDCFLYEILRSASAVLGSHEDTGWVWAVFEQFAEVPQGE
jgi:hypothetical protein